MKKKFKLSSCIIVLILSTWSAFVSAESLPDRLLPLEVVVNGAKSGTWLLLERGGQFYATHDAFDEWRVQLNPAIPSVSFKGQDYWALSAIPGYNAKIDLASQSLQLLFSPQAFSATRLTQELSNTPTLSPVLPSVFFNYDFSYTNLDPRGASSLNDVGLLSELGISTGWGVLTSSAAARNLVDDFALERRRLLRLETTFTKDFPNQNRTLKVGDSSTRVGMLGRNVYFGGVQYGTNFSLTPGYVSQPIPALTGLSAAPSTVELYINDVLRQVSNVPTGPFAIDNFPALTGNGEARLVVRDLLGRETVIVQSFFNNSQLLAKGLNDWTVEAGSVRQDLGTSSGEYGPLFASGTWRHGYSNSLTLESRAELTPDLRTVQLGAVSALPLKLLGSTAIISSHEDSLGSGLQWLLGLEHRGLRTSLYVQAQGASKDFRQLGQDVDIIPTKLQLAANWSYASDSWGTLGIGYASISRFDSPRIDTYSTNYSLRVGKNNSLNLSASYVKGITDATALGLNFIIPMDNNRLATVNATSREGVNDLYATTVQNPDYDNRLGWRVLAGQQRNHEREEVGAYYLGQHGVLSGDLSHSPDQTTVRVGALGGLIFADGQLFATERVIDSFALAEVSGYENVGVGLGSNVVTRTDKKGVALIPRLSAYQTNSIRLDPTELPISAELDSIEQYATPAWRSAVKVKFPVRSGRGALLKIVLDDGSEAPAGSIVQIDGDKEIFYVARRGEAFVTGLQPITHITLSRNNQQCKIDVKLPPEVPDEIPRVGPLLCKGVAR